MDQYVMLRCHGDDGHTVSTTASSEAGTTMYFGLGASMLLHRDVASAYVGLPGA